MTGRAPAPTAAEVQEVGELLARYWPGARLALSIYLRGGAQWSGALRDVRTLLQDVLQNRQKGHKVPVSVRMQLLQFAATYGTDTRTAVGVEALTVRKTVRWSQTEWEAIEAAARAAGVSEAEWIRNATTIAAKRTT